MEDRLPQQAGTPLRLPWSRPSWFNLACEWIGERANLDPLNDINSIEQVTCWEQSCVLKVPAPGETLYFKAVPLMYAAEITVSDFLSKPFPEMLPKVRAISRENRWILMHEFAGKALIGYKDEAVWAATIEKYVDIQRSFIDGAEALPSEIPRRPLSGLLNQIGTLLLDDDALLIGREGGFLGVSNKKVVP